MPDVDFRYPLLGALAIALLVAAYTDIRRRQIDNWLTGAIAATAPLFWWASDLAVWTDIAMQIGVALLTFALMAGLFALRAMGGGDVKLLTALALWVKPVWFLQLLVVMALTGGVLTLILGSWHVARRGTGQQRERLAIPYGVAIASAGLWVLVVQYLPGFYHSSASGAPG